MISNILGAAVGAEASKFTSAFGGPAGAVLGALATPMVRRLTIPGLILITAGGYFAKKWLENRKAKAETAASPRKAAVKRAASSRKRTRRTAPKTAAAAS